MRTGSTLLKALLAEAPDVSKLPEIVFTDIFKKNRHSTYFDVYRLSGKRIIVLKEPIWFSFQDYICPPLKNIKVIILIRNPIDVTKSLEIRWKRKEYREFVDYWCRTYESILDNKYLMEHDRFFVKYEDLVENPETITKNLFSFIGSLQSEGVSTYNFPKDHQWKFGEDDGGEHIKSLKVQRISYKLTEEDRELFEIINDSKRVSYLRDRFGYNSNWR